MSPSWLAAASYFCSCCSWWSCGAPAALRARRAAAAAIRPKLHASLVEFLAGGTDDSLFRSHIRTHPADIADVILLFQTTVGGSARDRVCDLALKLGLVHRWYEESRARDLVRRRTAFASLAFACVYEPCQRVAGDLLHSRGE